MTKTRSWDIARYDRLYVDSNGIRHILDGSAGHGGGGIVFHPCPRTGCPLCADGLRHRGSEHDCIALECVTLRFPEAANVKPKAMTAKRRRTHAVKWTGR